MHIRYIIAYRLKRKNARRRVYSKFDAIDVLDARKQFESYINYRKKSDDTSKQVWELLTGDWKHVGYWCEECSRVTNETCELCEFYELCERDGKKNEGLS